ncbi:unnamed protein product [Victoria cruziana]
MTRKRCRTGYGQSKRCRGASKSVGMYFFKVLIGDFHTKLYMPPAFARLIEDDGSGFAALNSSVGCYRGIEVLRDSYSLFFHIGWRAFVEHHSLQMGEFLVFRYGGRMQFDVKIFDRSGCEKVCFNPVQMKDSSPCNPKNTVSPLDVYTCDAKVSSESEEKVAQNGYQSSREKYKPSKHFVIESEVSWSSQVLHLPDHPVYKSTYRYASTRREVTKEERLQALEAAHNLNLTRPHFIAIMSETSVYRRFTLTIPSRFLLRFRLNREVILRSSNGISWQVRCCYDADGRAKFVRGWGPFSLANNLQEGDVCVFELTEGYSVMDVHVFRVVDEVTALFPCEKLRKKSKQKDG